MEGAAAAAPAAPLLMTPLKLRDLELKGRVMISPMCTYSAHEGVMDDFHLVHLGRFAMGGAALVMAEATAVSRVGRITHGCAGLWDDGQIAPLKRICDLLHRFGAAAGVQLSHAGFKAASQRPWEGGLGLTEQDLEARGEGPWDPLGVTSAPFDVGSPPPAAMTIADIQAVVGEFAAAARRADAAGVDVIELHCAHGYLLHAFLSPLANSRDDAYGGEIEGRMRFPLEVVSAVRAVWPAGKPLFVRISSVDGIDVGWSIEDSITFCTRLKALGVDVIDCSSGGMKLPSQQSFVWRGPGFHVRFAERVRQEVGIPTVAVGLITEPAQAEAVLAEGKADIVAIAREALFDPNWALKAELELAGAPAWSRWAEPFGWWLVRRSRQRRDAYSAPQPPAAP